MMLSQTTAPLGLPPRDSWEADDFGADPHSGARIVRLTSSALMSNMVYGENPFTSPDGRRIVVLRTADLLLDAFMLIVGDLETKQLSLVKPSIPSNGKRAAVPWGEWFYYQTHEGGVRRVSLVTLRKEAVLPGGSLTGESWLHNVMPASRLLELQERMPGGATRFVILDARTGERRVLAESPHFIDHELLEPGAGARLLFHEIVAGAVSVYVQPLDGTGRHRTLIGECQSYGIAGCSWYDPCPYFTADNRHVIYNASPFDLNQVFAAEVPDGFLAGLS